MRENIHEYNSDSQNNNDWDDYCDNCMNEDYEEEDMPSMLMDIAKEAKFELIKERIKSRIETAEGEKLDAIADLVVEVMFDKHKFKSMLDRQEEEMDMKWEDFEDRLMNIINEEEEDEE